MRVLVGGHVAEVGETRTFTRRDGKAGAAVDVYLKQPGGERYAADRVSLDPTRVGAPPVVGEYVQYVAIVQAKMSKAGREYLDCRAVERVGIDQEEPALRSVG
jgi:hypothetical protein